MARVNGGRDTSRLSRHGRDVVSVSQPEGSGEVLRATTSPALSMGAVELSRVTANSPSHAHTAPSFVTGGLNSAPGPPGAPRSSKLPLLPMPRAEEPSASFAFADLMGEVPLLQAMEPPVLVDMPPVRAEVQVVVAEAEWNVAGMDSDSDDSDYDARRGHRREHAAAATRQQLAHGHRLSGDADRGDEAAGSRRGQAGFLQVSVQHAAGEWAGAAGFDSEASKSSTFVQDNGAPAAAERRRQAAAAAAEEAAGEHKLTLAPGAIVPILVPTPPVRKRPWIRRCISCLWYTNSNYAHLLLGASLYLMDFCLRTCCLAIYFYHKLYWVAFFLLPWHMLGTVVCGYITFHDADVLLTLHAWRARCPKFRKCLTAVACIVFGCFQVIQVKRALARQLHQAEVLTDWADEDEDGANRTRPWVTEGERPKPTEGSFAAPTSVMPVSLITGIPFMIINWVWITQKWCLYQEFHEDNLHALRRLMDCCSIVLVLTVSLGIIEVDLSVSSYVQQRYHMNPHIRGHTAGRLQVLYPFLHMAFRVTEVTMNVLNIIALVDMIEEFVNQHFAYTCVFFDYCIGVFIMHSCSPSREHIGMHLISGLFLLVADIGYYVDVPSFAAPARLASRRINIWNAIRFGMFAVGNLIVFTKATRIHDNLQRGACGEWSWNFIIYAATGTFAAYNAMRCLPAFGNVGHDLHTAAMAGHIDRCKRLMHLAEKDDQVPDVNAPSKDNKEYTALMYAAEAGHLKIIDLLLTGGANINATNKAGDTSLHRAAMCANLDVCKLLIRNGADIQQRNSKGDAPVDVVPFKRTRDRIQSALSHVSFTSNTTRGPDRDILVSILRGERAADESTNTLAGEASDRKSSSANSSGTGSGQKYYSVSAVPCIALQLRSLFPDAGDDDSVPPRILQSMSALVASRALGPLAHKFLSCMDDDLNEGAGVQIGMLRRVGELGKGGFGRVIEVELPRSATDRFRRGRQKPRRFALKLQLKHDNRQAYSEVQALRRLDHPFIVRLERAFQTPKFFALLLELCPTDLNRELCKHSDTVEKPCLGLPAPVVARYLGQVLLALTHLHKKEGIVYRDTKPENILISDRDEAKLTDFGLAKVVSSAERMTMCGTVGFLPPETTTVNTARPSGTDEEKPVDLFKMDAYSFGVTLQVALLGEDGARCKAIRKKGRMMLPLHLTEEENTDLLAQLTTCGRLSQSGFNLLRDLLRFDPCERSALLSVVNHPFFQEELHCTDVEEFLVKQAIEDDFP